MSNVVQALILGICFAGLLGFAYSWYFLLKISGTMGLRWREWVSVGAIGLVSLTALSWFAMWALMPSADWRTGAGVGRQVYYVNRWTAVSILLCASALVTALAGRARLILPIAVACIGTAMFWVMSTIP